MSIFTQSLLSETIHPSIPAQDDLWGGIIGDWSFDWCDRHSDRVVKGEWHFARILEGAAIQDTFICPSRATRALDPQPDGEYGTTLRVYVPETHLWEVSYLCLGRMTRLTAKKVGDEIVLTVCPDNTEQWIFSEITPNTFHWQNVTLQEDGTRLVNADLYAVRDNG